MLNRWKEWARTLKRETYALYVAYRDPRVPWYARLFVICVVGYAFSAIDLIPDFIPVLGYLDDLVLIPLGIALAVRMIPPDVMRESRERANELIQAGKPVNRAAAVIIVVIWIAVSIVVVWLVVRR